MKENDQNLVFILSEKDLDEVLQTDAVFTNVSKGAFLCVCVCFFVCMFVYACAYVCVCVFMFACVCVCVNMCEGENVNV